MFRVPVTSRCTTRCTQNPTQHCSSMLGSARHYTTGSSPLLCARRPFTRLSLPLTHLTALKAGSRLYTPAPVTRLGGVSVRQLHTTGAGLTAAASAPRNAAQPTDPVEKAPSSPAAEDAGAQAAGEAGQTSVKDTAASAAEAHAPKEGEAPTEDGSTASSTAAAAATDTTASAGAVGAAGSGAKDGEANTEEKNVSWWRRWWRVFKSEGKDFTLFCLPIYPATFVILYVAFATKALHKETILDYVLDWMGDYVDRKKMYARIEAWNTWANLGFAFIINELIEVVRFPVAVLLYFGLKPYSTYFAHWMLRVIRKIRPGKAAAATKKEKAV